MSVAVPLDETCQRRHLDQATVAELLKALNTLSTFKDTPWGDMQVFRQFIPRKEAIEYTCYFYVDGAKMRLDYELNTEDILVMEDPEQKIKDILYYEIEKYIASENSK